MVRFYFCKFVWEYLMAVLQFFGSTTGRWVRVIAGIALAVIGGLLGGWWWLMALFGIFAFTSGAFDFCVPALLVKKPVNGAKFRATFTK